MSVLIFADLANGSLKKSAFELATYGKKIADKLSTDVVAVAFGTADASALAVLGEYGVSKVYHAGDVAYNEFEPQAYTSGILKAIETSGADVVVFPFDLKGKAIAPRISAKLGAGLVTGAVAVPEIGSSFVVKKSVFSGKAFANVEITTPKKVIALTNNSLAPEKVGGSASVEALSFEVSGRAAKVLGVSKAGGGVPLPEAELVVSAGRGLKGPENWGIIEELAEALGASTACSRPVSDIGWRPHHEHVGQTGVTIRPNLYIAVGISGAIQHLAGVNQSKTIVVINKDPEAPFFKAADYGVVGDAFEVVPKLTEAVKKFKAAQG